MPALPIRMPQLGESAAEAVVRTWLVAPGDPVVVDQDLVEVETEKSVLTVTAPADGTLLEMVAEAGKACAVGEILGHITVDDERAARPALAAAAGQGPLVDATAHEARERFAQSEADSTMPVPARAAGMGYFSPRLRARMSQIGLRNDDITAVRGTGRAGRVSVKDLERFLDELDQRKTADASGMRLAVADSMRRSWNRPLATIAMQASMDALLHDRRKRQGRPSNTIYAVRALALALAADDRVACRLVGRRLVHPERRDIALAIEVEDGVVTPVLPAADETSLEELTIRSQALLAQVQSGKARVESGSGVASVSNYGTFGITWATPVPLPDQSLILGLGSVRNTPDWDPKAQAWGRIKACELTLTFDHRVADGGAAGRLLKRVVDLLEHPERL